jgi:hypothetical protein
VLGAFSFPLLMLITDHFLLQMEVTKWCAMAQKSIFYKSLWRYQILCVPIVYTMTVATKTVDFFLHLRNEKWGIDSIQCVRWRIISSDLCYNNYISPRRWFKFYRDILLRYLTLLSSLRLFL